MLEIILDISNEIDRILWGPWTLVFIALVAIFLTVKSGFFQFRKIGFIFKNTFGKIFKQKAVVGKGKMTPFQATATALASTVGMGNIAGVATALTIGGPGAIFWMWLLALFGMLTKTTEITLAVHYRDIDKQGNVRGGPMYYIKKGLGWNFLAKLFCIGILINSVLASSILQAHTVGRAFYSAYNISPYIIVGAMIAVTSFVIIGGIKRIGQFCEALVPLMALLYIIGGIIIFFTNYTKIPEVFSLIFKNAFGFMSASGGIVGFAVKTAIKEGMAKGTLSSEAGSGTAPMVHATADTPHPFQQGIWGAFEVFIDTIVICTMTAFAVLSTGVLSNGNSGIELVMDAFSSVFSSGIAGTFISISILTFCLSTMIGFFIYFETAFVNVFNKKYVKYFRWLYLLPPILFAGVANVERLWVFANISVGVCVLPNLVALLALNGVFFKLMKDYMSGRNKYRTEITDSTQQFVKKAV
ncbi:alanine/glycine:cation symporter family protein [Acidobacteriota bacterium]